MDMHSDTIRQISVFETPNLKPPGFSACKVLLDQRTEEPTVLLPKGTVL